MSMLLWQLVVVVAALAWVYFRWPRRRLYRLAKELPSGLKEYPIIGHIYIFYGNSEDQMTGLQKLGRTANEHGGLSSFWLGYKLFISMTDPKSIELVTKTSLDKDEFLLKCVRTITGNGSIFAPVNIWNRRRKIISPFFGLKNLTHAVEIFNKQSCIMADLMRSQVGHSDFSIWKYMTTYTLDTILHSAAEIQTNFQRDPDNFVVQTINELTKIMATRMLQPWLHPDFIYERLPVYKRFLDLRRKGYEFIDEIIQNKRNSMAKLELEGRQIKKDGLASMFHVVMHTSELKDKAYSDVELREEAIVLCVAGNDTSAVASSFTAVMLSRYPDVQDKVYQELQEVFGDSDRAVTAEDLIKLKYLEAVIKETLRLYPPVPVIFREIRNDVVLPSGVTLVDGASIMINIWGTHRNPAYWGADAELFRPDRFLEGPLSHPAMFIPFSYSVRNCIGSTYAMLIVKTGLANLLRRYKVLPPANMAAADLQKPPRVEYELMMKDVERFIVRVEERNKLK